jgi:HSP20 family protein
MPWDPMRDLRAWHERLGRVHAHQADSWTPPIDIYETEDAYMISAEVPGLTRDEIDLVLEDTRLTIRGRRSDRRASTGGIIHFHQVERGHGPFARTFDFAIKIDVERVSADLTNGVLSVILPKTPQPMARRIDVK